MSSNTMPCAARTNIPSLTIKSPGFVLAIRDSGSNPLPPAAPSACVVAFGQFKAMRDLPTYLRGGRI